MDVVAEPAQFDSLTQRLAEVQNGLQRVVTRAVNKIGTAARTEIVRGVAKEVNLKVTDLKARNVTLSKASFDDPRATVLISGRRVPIYYWAGKPALSIRPRVGIAYAIRGSQTRIPGSFVAMMPTGHLGVFRRKKQDDIDRMLGQAKRAHFRGYNRSMATQPDGRLPIMELYGPSVPEVFEGIDDFAAGTLEARLQEKLATELETQAALVLEGQKPPAGDGGESA
jgi:hypothetical protein